MGYTINKEILTKLQKVIQDQKTTTFSTTGNRLKTNTFIAPMPGTPQLSIGYTDRQIDKVLSTEFFLCQNNTHPSDAHTLTTLDENKNIVWGTPTPTPTPTTKESPPDCTAWAEDSPDDTEIKKIIWQQDAISVVLAAFRL